MIKEKIIQKLHDFLLQERAIPERDAAEIITPAGIDAKVRIQTIIDCLNIIKTTNSDDSN